MCSRSRVAGDIRFYGLLKTIGTHGTAAEADYPVPGPGPLRPGHPPGAPGRLAHRRAAHPGHHRPAGRSVRRGVGESRALFGLRPVRPVHGAPVPATRPGRMAAKVSPIEAVRYTEGAGRKSRRPSGKRLAIRGQAGPPCWPWPGPIWAAAGGKTARHNYLPVPGGGAADGNGELHQWL